MIFFTMRALNESVAANYLAEASKTVEINVASAFDNIVAMFRGMGAVSGELGRFTAERIACQTTLANGFARMRTPMDALLHIADYVRAEHRAWESEQSRLVGLWAQSFTESLTEEVAPAYVPLSELGKGA